MVPRLVRRRGFGDGSAVFAGVGGAEVYGGGEIAEDGLAAAHVRGVGAADVEEMAADG